MVLNRLGCRRGTVFFALILVLAVAPSVMALEPAELGMGVGFGGAASSDRNVPLWLHANRDGLILDEQYQSYLSADVSYRQVYTPFWRGEAFLEVQRTMSSGEDMALRLPVAYGAVFGGPFVVHVGRYPLMIGDVSIPELSSGSFSVSNNAIPIPRITGRTDGYVPVPGLDGVVQTKFGLSHGWFEEDRSTANALLHEKWLYAKLQHEDKMSVWGGLVHQVMWGGENASGSALAVTPDNYFRIFTGRSGGNDASVSDQMNSVGNSLGIWDFGFSADVQKATLNAYYQHYFELASSMRVWSNGIDGLHGVTLEVPHPYPVLPGKFLFERILTDYQGGHLHDAEGYLLFGRQSYFRNSAYRSGWTHLGQMVGTPLVVTTGVGEDRRIASNRIKANHFGLSGLFDENLRYRLLYTMTRHHFPSYSEVQLYEEGTYWQYDGLFEVSFGQFPGFDSVEFSLGVVMTTGDLFDTTFGGVLATRIGLH